MSKRFLEEDTEKKSSGTDKVCELGSEELRDYYKTGDLKKIELEDKNIECKEKDEDYMKALISIVKSKAPSLRMRNLEGEPVEDNSSKKENDDDLTQNVITYGKHLLPPLVFMVIGILCIPGWIICCFCCCCNCCCCCCCKKPKCKIPCFIISYAMYALVVAVCIYGLSKSNHIFIGLADTECSILKFIDEVLDGESKETKPKWAGINGINNILSKLKTDINEMKDNTLDQLNTKLNDIENKDEHSGTLGDGTKKIFIESLSTLGTYLYNSETYRDENIKSYPHAYSYSGSSNEINYASGKYVLDLVKNFGTYNSDSKEGEPSSSLMNGWLLEYKAVAEIADEQMNSAKEGFESILDTQFDSVNNALDDGINKIKDMNSTFDNVKGEIANLIIDYSKTLDESGKLVVKLVFGVLALIDVGIAAFIFLLCFCSGKICVNCCCCRCLCKCGVHILWNILALLMIIVFIVGSLFALIGKIGVDTMSLFSYLVSEDNIGEGKETILLGNVKEYVSICINGDGKIEGKLGFTNSIDSFEDINSAKNDITDAKDKFNSKKDTKVAYQTIISELDKRNELNSDEFSLIKYDGDLSIKPFLKFTDLLEKINEYSRSEKKEIWDINCESTLACDDENTHENIICFKPSECLPSERQWIKNLPRSNQNEIDVQDVAQIILDMDNLITSANNDPDPTDTPDLAHLNDYSFRKRLRIVSNYYDSFLESYISALELFENSISRITSQLKEYTGNEGVFSFINCKFISTNLKVILKYLKESLGGDFYTVGVCLILVGCSLALSISSTILLIIIFNVDIEQKKKIEKGKTPDYPVNTVNSIGRVVRYSN